MFNWFKKKVERREMPHPDQGLMEKHEFQGKAVNVYKKKFDQPRRIHDGDLLIITALDKRRSFDIDRSMRVDEAFMFYMDDALGYTHVMIGGFGQVGD